MYSSICFSVGHCEIFVLRFFIKECSCCNMAQSGRRTFFKPKQKIMHWPLSFVHLVASKGAFFVLP